MMAAHTQGGRRPIVLLLAIATTLLAACGAGVRARTSDVSRSQAPTVGSCVAAWNSSASTLERASLDLSEVPAPTEVPAIVATYSGPTEDVSRFGAFVSPGPATFPVRSGTCIIVAGSQVFVQQTDQAWLQSEVIYTEDFSKVAADPTWTQDNANAHAAFAPPYARTGVGVLGSDSGAEIATLLPEDVNGSPAAGAAATSPVVSSAAPNPAASSGQDGNTGNVAANGTPNTPSENSSAASVSAACAAQSAAPINSAKARGARAVKPPACLEAAILAAAPLPAVSPQDTRNVVYVSTVNPAYAIAVYNPTPSVPPAYAQGFAVFLREMQGTWITLRIPEPCDGNGPAVPASITAALCAAHVPPVSPEGGAQSASGSGQQTRYGLTCGTVVMVTGLPRVTVFARKVACSAALKVASDWTKGHGTVDGGDTFRLDGFNCSETSESMACGGAETHVYAASPQDIKSLPLS